MENEGDTLKDAVLRCRSNPQERRKLLAVLARRVYGFAGLHTRTNEDEPGDFLVFMYPRLERLIDRYRDEGVPFEHYLNSVLAWNLRSYRRSSRAGEARWQAGRISDFWPESSGTAGEVPGVREPETTLALVPPLPRPAERKRFLLLVLRNCWRLDSGSLAKAAAVARVSAPWLSAAAERLRGALGPRLARLQRLRARRDAAFAGMRLAQQRWAAATDPQERRRLEPAIAREAAGWRRANGLIARVPLEPTHRRIASEIGMPRGTVDTCLRAALHGGLPRCRSIG